MIYVSTDDSLMGIWKEFTDKFKLDRFFISPNGDLFDH